MTPVRVPSSAAAAACRRATGAASTVSARRACQRCASSARPAGVRLPGPACNATRHGSEASRDTGGLPGRRVATRIRAAAASPFALWASIAFDVAHRASGGASARDIATVAIAALDCALSGAHVGVSRPRCLWQLGGWRHSTTPSREPHERSSYHDPCRHWPGGRFCRLSLPLCPILHPVAGRGSGQATGAVQAAPEPSPAEQRAGRIAPAAAGSARVRRRYHVALISNPTVCSGAALSLSRRIALKPNDRSGVLAASGVHRQPRV